MANDINVKDEAVLKGLNLFELIVGGSVVVFFVMTILGGNLIQFVQALF